MNVSSRNGHTATMLATGNILIAGGWDHTRDTYPPTAALYDPLTGMFSDAAPMNSGRQRHTATLLKDGNVLVAGGCMNQAGGAQNEPVKAEIYNPITNKWTVTPPMPTPNRNQFLGRSEHAASLLPDGRVLITGGVTRNEQGRPTILDTVLIYTPGARGGAWTNMGSIQGTGRHSHTSTLIGGRYVIIIGGKDSAFNDIASLIAFDCQTNRWLNVNPMARGAVWADIPVARYLHTATLSPHDDYILAAGGYGVNDAYRFYIKRNVWEFAGILNPECPAGDGRSCHTANLLSNARTLVACGRNNLQPPPLGQTVGDGRLDHDAPQVAADWDGIPPVLTRRFWHTGTLGADGHVLLLGGLPSPGVPAITPGANQPVFPEVITCYDDIAWEAGRSLQTARYGHTATLLKNGRVLVVGGTGADGNPIASTELISEAGVPLRADQPLRTARSMHTATLMSNGDILVIGGKPAGGRFARRDSAVRYQQESGQWQALCSMPAGKVTWSHTATLLSSGQILVLGGKVSENQCLNGALLYDPASDQWRELNFADAVLGATMNRCEHRATLMPDGRILVSGGQRLPAPRDGRTDLRPMFVSISVDTGDVVLEEAAPNQQLTGRQGHNSILLPDGSVLICGGRDAGGREIASSLRFDPPHHHWEEQMMTVARGDAAAILLNDMRVLVAGGATAPAGAEEYLYLNNYDNIRYNGQWANAASPAPLGVRTGHTCTMLTDGSLFICGGKSGNNASATTCIARIAPPGLTAPYLDTPIAEDGIVKVGTGANITLTGHNLAGPRGTTSGACGAADGCLPVAVFYRIDSGSAVFGTTVSWNESQTIIACPRSVKPGPHLLYVVTNGVRSNAICIEVIFALQRPQLQGRRVPVRRVR
jgi:N-acetylneuraminic acid mutarotase